MAIARVGTAVNGSYQASKRCLNVHSNQADSKSKPESADLAMLFAGHNTQITIKFIGGKMLKKVPNAEWAKIAVRAMKGKSVELEDICSGNWHLRKFPISGTRKIVKD